VNPFTAGLVIAGGPLRDGTLAALADLPVRKVLDCDQTGDIEAFARLVQECRPDVLIIDVTRLNVTLEFLVDGLRRTPWMPFLIAMHDTADPGMILRAMRAGFNEYLFPPFDETMRSAIETWSAGRRRNREAKEGRTLGVLAATGGCGATTIACHMARELVRQSQIDVLLADLDLHSGMVKFLMKTTSSYSMEDAFNNLHRLDASYWGALTSSPMPRLEVIAAPDPAMLRETPRPEQVAQVLTFVRTQYDWSVIDLGRGINFQLMNVLDEIDETFLVTTLDTASLHRAKEILQKLTTSGYGRNRLRLVLNDRGARSVLSPVEIEKVLGWPVYGALPEDGQALYEAYTAGHLLPPSARLSKQIAQLARKVAGFAEAKEKRLLPAFWEKMKTRSA
jgi:pilus assembly protein CpaE